MINKYSRVVFILATLVIAGCASGANSVAPIALPSSNYKGLSCDETKTALTTARARQAALTESQDNAQIGDAIGVFFVLLPLGSIFGDESEGDLALAKGEVLALQGAVPINCREDRAVESAPKKHKESISVRLEKIRSLLKDGLITQQEADQKKWAILDDM